MNDDFRNALLTATACVLGLETPAPAAAATTFVSAEATVFAQAQVTFSVFDTPPPVTKNDFSGTVRRLVAEADVSVGTLAEDVSQATASALADFAPDGSQGRLSVG